MFGKLLRQGRLSFNGDTALALGWTLLAQLSPALLRFLLKVLLRARNFAARPFVKQGRVYEWRPGASSLPLP